MSLSAVDRIYITPLAFHKLRLYIELCPVEIGGLGQLEWVDGQLVVTDLFLLPQRVTAFDTELDAEHLCEFLADCVAEEKDPASLKVWWHSHGEMDVEWSATDLQTISELPGEFFVSIVGNKKSEFVCRIDIFAPSRLVIDDLDLVPLPGPMSEGLDDLRSLRRAIQAEITEKVKVSLSLSDSELQEWSVAFVTDYRVHVDAPSAQLPGE